MYLEKAFDGTGLRPSESLTVAKQLGDTSIMLLVHPTITSDQMQKAAEQLARILTAARR